MHTAFAVLLFVAASVSAAPVITSVTPNAGLVAGGQTVTIKGSGFDSTATVVFGSTPLRSVQFVDATTLIGVTPPMLPHTYDVTVFQSGSAAFLGQVYTVTGDPSDVFETILVPIYSPTTRGAYGAIFISTVVAATKTNEPVDVYGATNGSCGLLISPPPPQPDYMTVMGQLNLVTDCSPGVSRLLYVRTDQAPNLAVNARVTDITRTSSSLGTEIPVIRAERMTSGPIVLPNVPIDGRYRLLLRIYALQPASVQITTVGNPVLVALQPGRDIFEPAYAEFSAFPIPIDPGSRSAIRVLIEPALAVIPGTGTLTSGPPVWAFITVTNNETQQITTISPQ